MEPPWFTVEQVPEVGEVALLDPRECRHATGSRRLSEGAEVVLFDGAGTVAEAALVEAGAADRAPAAT